MHLRLQEYPAASQTADLIRSPPEQADGFTSLACLLAATQPEQANPYLGSAVAALLHYKESAQVLLRRIQVVAPVSQPHTHWSSRAGLDGHKCMDWSGSFLARLRAESRLR